MSSLMMSSLSRELVFIILQFLDEEKFRDAVHKLEQESGYFFNIMYFEELVMNGDWEELDKYLSGFTKVEDNRYSMKIYFEIRKQKYLEALDRKDLAKAVVILAKDLKVFSGLNEGLFKELTQLLTLENFRDNEQLSRYGDTKSARGVMLIELRKLIEANPLFRDKLNFPSLKNSRLRTLINQSLNWQHQLCKNPKPNPDIKSLFIDHSCNHSQLNGAHGPALVTNTLLGGLTRGPGLPPHGAHGPFQPGPASISNPLGGGWMTNSASVSHGVPSVAPINIGFTPPNSSGLVKRQRSPAVAVESEHTRRRGRHLRVQEEVKVNILPANTIALGLPSQSRAHKILSPEEIPRNVIMTIGQGSVVKSLDFHPNELAILVVGTSNGDVMVWDLGKRHRVAVMNFKVWEMEATSLPLQASLQKDHSASVNRASWSPDGSLLGVAYSKHLVHIYFYCDGGDVSNHLEIDAHNGSVNDIVFSDPHTTPYFVTCGDDHLIKVWDAISGDIQHTFEGHQAPVNSVCPHHKESIQFVFSTSTDGKIKAWLYDDFGSRVDYDAPGHSTSRMAYSADGVRLFSCGTNKEGESFLVEWNEDEGTIISTYNGLGRRSEGVLHFDTTKNRFIAAGDEFKIKLWDMDSHNLLTTIDAEGGLPASPCIRFNKAGNLLAVSTNDNGMKILASSDGMKLLRAAGSFDTSRAGPSSMAKKPSSTVNFGVSNASGTSFPERVTHIPPSVTKNGDSRPMTSVNIRIGDESVEKSRSWKLTEINEPAHCRSVRLPDSMPISRVSRLVYTNSALAVLALSGNGVHKLWKWPRNERNVSGKATANAPPQLWQPSTGQAMTNHVGDGRPEDAVSCFALSKNDSYIMSTSGGKITLFNLMTFKTMTTFMAPPPTAASLAFHPQDNNIIAVGMEDSFIQIYNVRVDEVKTRLKGHQKRVTGLAFSNVLKVLVSAGADAQLCVWGTDEWEKQAIKCLEIPNGQGTPPFADTGVQFHLDQIHLLVAHETQLAIYKAPKLECVKQWVAQVASGPIAHATYSCDGHTVYASFQGGSIGVFTAPSLQLRCRINISTYLPNNLSPRVYPVVVAANPLEPNQFAVGLTDGSVHVLEPLEAEAKWGTPPPDNGAGPSTAPAPASEKNKKKRRDI